MQLVTITINISHIKVGLVFTAHELEVNRLTVIDFRYAIAFDGHIAVFRAGSQLDRINPNRSTAPVEGVIVGFAEIAIVLPLTARIKSVLTGVAITSRLESGVLRPVVHARCVFRIRRLVVGDIPDCRLIKILFITCNDTLNIIGDSGWNRIGVIHLGLVQHGGHMDSGLRDGNCAAVGIGVILRVASLYDIDTHILGRSVQLSFAIGGVVFDFNDSAIAVTGLNRQCLAVIDLRCAVGIYPSQMVVRVVLAIGSGFVFKIHCGRTLANRIRGDSIDEVIVFGCQAGAGEGMVTNAIRLTRRRNFCAVNDVFHILAADNQFVVTLDKARNGIAETGLICGEQGILADGRNHLQGLFTNSNRGCIGIIVVVIALGLDLIGSGILRRNLGRLTGILVGVNKVRDGVAVLIFSDNIDLFTIILFVTGVSIPSGLVIGIGFAVLTGFIVKAHLGSCFYNLKIKLCM